MLTIEVTVCLILCLCVLRHVPHKTTQNLHESVWEFQLGVAPWEGTSSQGPESSLCFFMSLREVTVTRTETISDRWYACYVPGNGIIILSLPPRIASPGLKYKGQRGNIWTFAEVQRHGTWQRPDLEHSVLFPRPVSTRPAPGFWLLPRFHYTDSIGQGFTALRDHNLICTHP